MPRKTVIEKLPKEVRAAIGDLRDEGRTIDEILAKLGELKVTVARSTLGRHIAMIDKIGAHLAETRQVADALVARFGERDDNKMLALNIELLQPVIMKLLTVDGSEGDVPVDAKSAMMLAMALKNMSQAQASDTARQLKERTVFAAEAAKKVDAVGKAQGLTGATVTAIKEAILGVKATPPAAP